jgi:hypothetical protein
MPDPEANMNLSKNKLLCLILPLIILIAGETAGATAVRRPTGMARVAAVSRTFDVITDFNFTLQPGVFHGFIVGESTARRGFVTEVTPLSPSDFNGASITSFVHPEFNAGRWLDVLRVQLRGGSMPVNANLRVYSIISVPRVADINFTLQPGVAHGFVMGPVSENRGYVTEVTPSTPVAAQPESFVQPEFSGVSWNDVLRVQLLFAPTPVDANLRVYLIRDVPKAADFNFTLQPGVAHGFVMGPVSEKRGYVTEVTPSSPSDFNGASITSFVQPEFNGVGWSDVLRVVLNGGFLPVNANVRAYVIRALH